MANLRITNYKAVDSRTIAFAFNLNLASTINASNITITSFSYGVPDPTIISIAIDTNILTITTTPLSPFAIYTVKLFSTLTNQFKSVNGEILVEDGKTNAPLITAPANPENNILDNFKIYLEKTPYTGKLDGPSVISNYLNAMSDVLYKTENTINQLKSENYLSITETDEVHVRGAGPYDRLEKEGVYEIIRVGQYASDVLFTGQKVYSSFPETPITLQAKAITNEALVVGNDNSAGTFNGIICNTIYNNITKISAITVVYGGGGTATYDIDAFGYQIKDAKYDEKASTYILLETNQFRFSEKSLKSGFIPPVAGDRVIVSYEYKDLGIYIDPTSISVNEIKLATRKVCPPIASTFSLDYQNIVNSSGDAITLSGVTFYDPKATPPYSAKHPAFMTEMLYSENSFPSAPGYYSINYTTGKVYVYGADSTKENVGTGPFPPVCTYYYKEYYRNTIDYTYEPTLLELASNSQRDMYGRNIIVDYKYSSNYVPGVDYEPQTHIEVLSERIENRLYGLSTIEVVNKPITNVFRIFNETSGEVYRLNRFTDSRISFNYNKPPMIVQIKNEKTNFVQITDEILLSTETLTNTSLLNIWKIELRNNYITAASGDCIGSSINTSVSFSDAYVFVDEMYWNRNNTLISNLDKLTSIGLYCIDYDNGIIYVAVPLNQIVDIGTVSYKNKYIETARSHILSVDNAYTRVDLSSDIYTFKYNTFTDTTIELLTYDISDNEFVSMDPDIPYLVLNNSINLPRNAKALRGVYESYNLNTSLTPINFAENSIVNFSTAQLSYANVIETSVVAGGNTISVPTIAANANFELNSIVYVNRLSDGYELYNTTLANGSFAGSTITLPTDTLGMAGDAVQISINITLANNAAVILDIDFGGLFVDYTALFDEIIISYEYGDNVLDFRNSLTVKENSPYFVSYKYGALRDTLFSNFGSIINIDDFRNFDVDLERERYRDALMACLQNFPQGPTKTAISEMAKIISHVTPIITESLFEEWVLGLSCLYDKELSFSGCSLLSSIWDYGIYFENKADYVKLPFSNHIKLDRGTTEFWVTPNWNGLDNDATLTMQIYKNGSILPGSKIWIGVDGYNPVLDVDNKFSLSKFNTPSPNGTPNTITLDGYDGYGCYIYYDIDDSHWKFIVKDIPTNNYMAYIATSGEFYDVQTISSSLETTDWIRTTNKLLTLNLNIDSYDPIIDGYEYDGVSFMSDDEHYLLDCGESLNENRICIFKDGRGYLNFRVYSKKDRFGRAHHFQVSHDISDWKSGDNHHIAFSNIINSKDSRDELHFFIDGFEVPNIIKYGGRPLLSATDRFRTVVPEIVVGTVPRDVICGTDLQIISGSDIVTSTTTDFSILATDFGGIGHMIYIEELGFAVSYTILNIIDFHTLQLSSVMPYSLNNATFCVNKWSAPVSTELMYESNLYVSRYYFDPIDGYTEIELPGLRATNPSYSVSVDGYGQPSLVLRNNAETGDQIFIRTLGLNHRRCRERAYVWGNSSNIINLNLPPPITLDYAKIFAVNKSKYVMNAAYRSEGYAGYASETFIGMGILTQGILPDTQPSNSITGRTLAVTVSGTNIDYSIPAIIAIRGTTYSGATSEFIFFDYNQTINTTEYFTTITSLDAYVGVLNLSQPSMSFEIRELYQITKPENDGYVPILRFSYQENASVDLDGYLPNTITSDNISFFQSQIGDTLLLSDPPGVAGSYIITDVIDYNTIEISPNLSAPFMGGSGGIYNVSISRSGFANGLFTFELAGITPTAYLINQGFYDFDYATYLEIPFEIRSEDLIIGNNIEFTASAKAIIEEVRALDYLSVDTRIGEVVPSTGRSITTDSLTNNAFTADSQTTLLMHMNSLPPANSAIPYNRFSDQYFQFDYSLNDTFQQSLYIGDKPFILDNGGILSSNTGTIEFWVNPDFDSKNDNKYRYMFDTNSSTIEETVSITRGIVKLSKPASHVYTIQLLSDTSTTGTNYAAGGTLGADKQTYTVGRSLPYQQTPVKVVYTPYSVYGSRISIYKDPNSVCIFSVISGNTVYTVETPIFWSRDTWHRIMATWDFTKPRLGEMHFFVDGEEKAIVASGTLLSGSGFVSGSVSINSSTNLNVSIKDQFQTLYIGSNFLGGELMSCRIDNLKISRKKKAPVYIGVQAFDNDYTQNILTAMPVVTDLYTTYLSDFDRDLYKIEDFTILKNKTTGMYDFTLQVIDSFDIINDSTRVKQILESLVETLKPANARAFIEYTK